MPPIRLVIPPIFQTNITDATLVLVGYHIAKIPRRTTTSETIAINSDCHVGMRFQPILDTTSRVPVIPNDTWKQYDLLGAYSSLFEFVTSRCLRLRHNSGKRQP